MRRLFFLLPVAFAALLLGWYENSAQQPALSLANGASFQKVPCWFKLDKSNSADCGYLHTRQAADEPTFRLPVVILRHGDKPSISPILHISGGPGGNTQLDQAGMEFWAEFYADLDPGVDLVLYDQRGAGMSNPHFSCPNSSYLRAQMLASPLRIDSDGESVIRQMQQCRQNLMADPDTKRQLSAIGTEFSIRDIADLHDLLGIEKWTLLGVSYGTRVALEMARHYPSKVKSLVLDSVYPPRFDGFETMTENSLEGIERLLDRCESEDGCRGAYPQLGDLFERALWKLDAQPMHLEHSLSSGKQFELMLTPHRLLMLVDYTSYLSDTIGDIPAAIQAVLEDKPKDKSLQRLATTYLEMELGGQFSEPVFLATECTENGDFDRATGMKRIQPWFELYPMIRLSEDVIFYNDRLCDGWSNKALASARSFRDPVVSAIPTLVLSGELDSVTPAKWGRALANQLRDIHLLEYPGSGHAVLFNEQCAIDEVRQFISPAYSEKQVANCDTEERQAALKRSDIAWQFPVTTRKPD